MNDLLATRGTLDAEDPQRAIAIMLANEDCTPTATNPEPTPAAFGFQARITECLTRAVRTSCDGKRPATGRDVIRACLYTLCKERVQFLRAALHYRAALNLDLPDVGRHSLTELIVHPPSPVGV